MSLQLYFNSAKVPRTIGREEWKLCWRWVRVCRKRLAEQLEKERELLLWADLPSHIKHDIMDKMVNPPLLLGPHMDRK